MDYHFSKMTELFRFLNFRISHLFHVTVNHQWGVHARQNNVNRIYFIIDGRGYLDVGGQHIDLIPNNVYLIPANLRYNYGCDEHMEKIFIHFNVTIIPQKDLLSNVNKVVCFQLDEHELNKVKNIFYMENTVAAMLCQSYINRFISEVIEPFENLVAKDIVIYRKYSGLYNYVKNHLYADLTVKQICDYLKVSQRKISYSFKNDTGQTIKEYISDQMIEKLKFLFQSTSLSIKRISDELMFSNEFYCSKFFKNHTGISPREYRKNYCDSII